MKQKCMAKAGASTLQGKSNFPTLVLRKQSPTYLQVGNFKPEAWKNAVSAMEPPCMRKLESLSMVITIT